MTIKSINHKLKNFPIGVFDSGMGGLTVLKDLKEMLPNESLIYLGDTARLPYGTKSLETVQQYAQQMVTQLMKHQIKMLVIACNTASTAALDYLRQSYPTLPVIGVIEPSAELAANTTKHEQVAVIATETTIASNIYHRSLQRFNSRIQTLNLACGLFVALAEEGCIDDSVANCAVEKYLAPVKNAFEKIDTLILGCTHFPVLKATIQAYLGDNIKIIDSGEAVASYVQRYLNEHQLQADARANPLIQFYVTDAPARFLRLSHIFFSRSIADNEVQLIDITAGKSNFG